MATTLRTSGINMGDSTMDVSGSAPSFPARAWVNFNGTGVVAIRASGNVSSITDQGTGLYAVNFTTAMADANYAVAGLRNDSSYQTLNGLTASAVNLANRRGDGLAIVDANPGCVAIFH